MNTINITDTGLDSREADITDETDARAYYATLAQAPVKPVKPALNYGKLAQWNSRQPYHKRVSAADVESNAKQARFRGFAAALLVSIHAKIDPQIAAREALLTAPADMPIGDN